MNNSTKFFWYRAGQHWLTCIRSRANTFSTPVSPSPALRFCPISVSENVSFDVRFSVVMPRTVPIPVWEDNVAPSPVGSWSSVISVWPRSFLVFEVFFFFCLRRARSSMSVHDRICSTTLIQLWSLFFWACEEDQVLIHIPCSSWREYLFNLGRFRQKF